MAKRTTKSAGAPRGAGGKSLVIVESPAKARTISGFLGRDFVIEASIGHVRDLPQGAKQIPAQYKKEDWAYLGVNVHDNFSPVYIVPPGKTEQVRKLRALVKDAKELYLATDEDREGEAISWHLLELLKPKVPVRRLVFHEITKEAIQEALEHPRQIDDDLVRAQETRRILDRLYGYEVSPLLWRKVRPKLSAGRVQSVAVRLIVERERQRMAFVSATYWDLLGLFAKQSNQEMQAGLVSYQGRQVPTSKDFDSTTGKIKDPNLLLLNEQQVNDLAARLRQAEFSVTSVETTPYTSKPYPPFTTSTLQQEANRKLGFTARRTMQAAQSLYENGHITYMRTDSTNLAKVAIDAARDLVETQYGREYLPAQPRIYATKVKNAQEAHEAIRPAGHPFTMPEALRHQLSGDEFRLYDLIWKRTVACQMADARGRRISVTIEGSDPRAGSDPIFRASEERAERKMGLTPSEASDAAVFRVGGKTIDFAGYLRAYVEGSDDPEAELADRETVLPSVEVGEKLTCREIEAKSHTTQPPGRYNEATLTRALEEMGIGRPSTYAAIIDTILARDYVFKRGNALVPTWTAFAVARLLESHLPTLVDYQFTAQMEDDLDAISRGETKWVDYLHNFYFGNGREGLKKQLDHKVEEIDARDVSRVHIGTPEGADPIYVRVGRYGPFLEQGERRASIPDGTPPDELNVSAALDLLGKAQQAEEPLGICPDTHRPVYLKVGRFGPYVQRGRPDDEEKPQNASLLKGMQPEDITLPVALKLLSLPRDLGPHPEGSPLAGEAVVVNNGRFGPYVKCGAETRSLPAGVSPLEVTLAEALALLAEPKKARRGFGAPREPLKALGVSSVTKEPIQLFEGRYGLYVTDGTTNASLPKGLTPDELTLEQAVELLAERAARGPAKQPARRGPAARRAASNGESAPKRPAKKKAAPRKKGGK